MGMNPAPMKSYSIASRLICGKCSTTPEILEAKGEDMLTITVQCHGEQETKMISKASLVTAQFVFDTEE